ncbi:MAG: hypothetical protein IPH45_15260 [Bacteroidales bacterium]|nr:hypothetical protein [Bacteroidales bacterium]
MLPFMVQGKDVTDPIDSAGNKYFIFSNSSRGMAFSQFIKMPEEGWAGSGQVLRRPVSE